MDKYSDISTVDFDINYICYMLHLFGYLNPSNAEATFLQTSRTQRFLKT